MTTEQMIRRELRFRYRARAPFRFLGWFVVWFAIGSTALFAFGQLCFHFGL